MEKLTKEVIIKNKKYIFIGIIVLIIIAIIVGIILNSNNDKKYLEVAEEVLPIMESDYISTQEIYIEFLDDILERRVYQSEEEAIDSVKATSSYRGYVLAIDKHLSEQYKDLEYLKHHTYSKDKELSNKIKDIVNEYEIIMNAYKELDYNIQEEDFFEKINKIINLVNKE